MARRQAFPVFKEILHAVFVIIFQKAFKTFFNSKGFVLIRKQANIYKRNHILSFSWSRTSDNYNKVLLSFRSKLKRNSLRQLLRHWVFNVPWFMFDFAVHDSVSFNLKGNRLIINEVWEFGVHGLDIVCVITLINWELNNLLAVAEVGHHESGSKQFARIIRVEVHYVRVNVEDWVHVLVFDVFLFSIFIFILIFVIG